MGLEKKLEHSQCRKLLACEGHHLSNDERERWERMLGDWQTRLEYPGYSNMLNRLQGCIEQSVKARRFAAQVAEWLTQAPTPEPVAPKERERIELGEKPIAPSSFKKIASDVRRGWEEIDCETGIVVCLDRQEMLVSHSSPESSDGYRPALTFSKLETVTVEVGRRGPIEVPEDLAAEYAAEKKEYEESLATWVATKELKEQNEALNEAEYSAWRKEVDAWLANPVNLVHKKGLRVVDDQIVVTDPYEGYERVLNVWSVDQL